MAWVVEKVSSHVLRACSAREDDKKEGTVLVEVDSAGQKLKCSHAFILFSGIRNFKGIRGKMINLNRGNKRVRSRKEKKGRVEVLQNSLET
jgi:hypothetical protein